MSEQYRVPSGFRIVSGGQPGQIRPLWIGPSRAAAGTSAGVQNVVVPSAVRSTQYTC